MLDSLLITLHYKVSLWLEELDGMLRSYSITIRVVSAHFYLWIWVNGQKNNWEALLSGHKEAAIVNSWLTAAFQRLILLEETHELGTNLSSEDRSLFNES